MANANFFSPDGGITRYPLEDTEGRIMYADDIDGINLAELNLADIKALNTNGTWSGNSYTLNGATLTVNSNNTIDLISSGPVSANVIFYLVNKPNLPSDKTMVMNGCPQGGSASTYEMQYSNAVNQSYIDRGDGVDNVQKFDYNTYPNSSILIKVWAGANIGTSVTFYPMITTSEYVGVPYRPYNQQSIQHQINDITGVTGVRNWLPHTYTGGAIQGVTYNFNSNDELVAQWSSTPTGSAIITYTSEGKIHLIPGKTYKLTGCPSGGEWSTNTRKYRIYLYDTTNGIEVAVDTGNGAIFTASNTSYAFYVVIGVNAGASGSLTFKPMISLASDPSTEFVPHVMTNRELTEVVETAITSIRDANGYYTKTNNYAWTKKNGKQVELFLAIKAVTPQTSWVNILNSSDIPKVYNDADTYVSQIFVGLNGSLLLVSLGSSGLLVQMGSANDTFYIHLNYICE